jgi:hypothetical protein
VVAPDSFDTLKADATFYVRRGLADGSCYSFESRNYPGQYLRHSSFRLRVDPIDTGSTLYTRDATLCAQSGRFGAGGTTLASYNLAGRNIRHYGGEVWIASSGGPQTFDSAGSYDADVTWSVTAPWAP